MNLADNRWRSRRRKGTARDERETHQEIRLLGLGPAGGAVRCSPRGEGGGLYLATTGIGVRSSASASGHDQVRPWDVVIAGSPLGDYGTAVMPARGELDLDTDILSDRAPVTALAEGLGRFAGLRFMRDPARSGLATVANEVLAAAGPLRACARSMCCSAMGCNLFVQFSGSIPIIWLPRGASRPPYHERMQRLR